MRRFAAGDLTDLVMDAARSRVCAIGHGTDKIQCFDLDHPGRRPLRSKPITGAAEFMGFSGERRELYVHDAPGRRLLVGTQVVECRDGWLTRNQLFVPHARLQSWSLGQGPFDARLGLAQIRLHIASTFWTATAEHLDPEDARRFVLEQGERSRLARGADLLRPAAELSS